MTIHAGICAAHPALDPIIHNLQPPCQPTEAIMTQKYRCPCSKCDMGSKVVSKCMIEKHLLKDQEFFDTLPPGTDSAAIVKSCINRMSIFLSQIHGGTRMLDTALDADGSPPEGSEGVFLKF